MNHPLTVEQPRPLTDLTPEELQTNIERVLNGELAGFIMSAAVPDAFSRSIQYATELGLSGAVNSTSMVFDYETTVLGLAEARAKGQMPGPEDWELFGITSLHADGEEGDAMLSISNAKIGAYTINVLKRGPATLGDMPIELWDSLQEENTRLILDGLVNPNNLLPEMTSLHVSAGDTVIFNPSQPHMGITTQAPRRAETTFYRRVQ